MVVLRKGSPLVNWFAARNQDGVLSHREWTAFRLPRGSRLSWAGCSQPLGKSLSRKAIAAVLLPKRFDHGCFAGGLAIGERLAARNQDGVLSHREWTAFRLPRGSRLSWAVAVNHWESSLSRKAIAAVLLPKRFDHGCSAGGVRHW